MKSPVVAKAMQIMELTMSPDIRKVYRQAVAAEIAILKKHNNGEKPSVTQVLQTVQAMAQAVAPPASSEVAEGTPETRNEYQNL